MSPTPQILEIKPQIDTHGKLTFDFPTSGEIEIDGERWRITTAPERLVKLKFSKLPSGAPLFEVTRIAGDEHEPLELSSQDGFTCAAVDAMLLHFTQVEGTTRKRAKSATIQIYTPGKE